MKKTKGTISYFGWPDEEFGWIPKRRVSYCGCFILSLNILLCLCLFFSCIVYHLGYSKLFSVLNALLFIIRIKYFIVLYNLEYSSLSLFVYKILPCFLLFAFNNPLFFAYHLEYSTLYLFKYFTTRFKYLSFLCLFYFIFYHYFSPLF